MKVSALTLAAVTVLLTGTVNLDAQPGHAKNKKAKHYPSHKAAGLHDNRIKKSYHVYNGRDGFINYRGHDYKYADGRFYSGHAHGFRMVPAPYGIRVSYLPHNYVVVNVGRVPYFYYEGVFYSHNKAGRYYEVVMPPVGAIVPCLPGTGVRKMIYRGRSVQEYDNVLYQPVTTELGIQFRVAGILGAVFMAI